MRQDQYGQPVDLPAERALADWNAVMQGVLSHSAAAPAHLAACLEAAPDFALGHATKGLFLVLLGRRELFGAASESLAAARAAFAPDARTRAMIDALAACIDGYPVQAVTHLSAHVDRAPGDALLVKLEHGLRFVLGDARGMNERLRAVAPAYGADHPAAGYIGGCRAFALEETGAYGDAVRAGHDALDRAPDDAWGLHAVAHVHDMRADAAAGIEWLTRQEGAWAHCNNFRYHVWWHKALMLLDIGRFDEALALYDHEIRAERTDDYRDIANATSLLSRLELEGVAIGDRWSELADLSERRFEDGCLIFADLHYLLALVGDGRRDAAQRLVARIARDGTGDTDTARRMARPGVSAARGLAAFGEGRYDDAFRDLATAQDSLHLAGGSHAQRDVFERLTIDAGIRAGAWGAAERILDRRQRTRGRHEDGYAATRRALIDAGRGHLRTPAE